MLWRTRHTEPDPRTQPTIDPGDASLRGYKLDWTVYYVYLFYCPSETHGTTTAMRLFVGYMWGAKRSTAQDVPDF
jgi:hypothetical protein